MPDITTPEEPQAPQKGGAPVRSSIESAPQQSDMSRRGFLGALAGLGALAIAGRSDSSQAAPNAPVDTAPKIEQQQVLELDKILEKSLVDKDPIIAREKLKKNPVDIIHSTERLDFNGNVVAQYFLVKDKVAHRVFSRVKQADGTFSETKIAGNVLPMKNPRKVAADSLGNILVVGQEREEVFSPPAMAYLLVNNPSFVRVSFGYDNKAGDISAAIPTRRPGTFLVNFVDADTNTADGIKIATLELQASQSVQPLARVKDTTIQLKDTSLKIGLVADMILPPASDFQAQEEGKISFLTSLAQNAQGGVTRINELNLDNAIGSAEQLVPQIGKAHKLFVVDSKKEMLAVNNSSQDFFVFNPTTKEIDLTKSFNYRKLVEGNKRFPESYGGGAITGLAKVGNRFIALVAYGDNQGKSKSALFDWDQSADIDANPELVNIQLLEKEIESGSESMTLVMYDGQPALSIDLEKKLGKITVPVSASGVPDISKILYDDAGMQPSIVNLPVGQNNYSSTAK